MKSFICPFIPVNKDLLNALDASWYALKLKRCVRAGLCSILERDGHNNSRYGKQDNKGKPRELSREGGKRTPSWSMGEDFTQKDTSEYTFVG